MASTPHHKRRREGAAGLESVGTVPSAVPSLLPPTGAPTASQTAFLRSQRTVKDFVRTYFPLYGLTPDDFLEVWAVLAWVETTIYQIDEENEAHTKLLRDSSGAHATQARESEAVTQLKAALMDGLRAIDPADHRIRRVESSREPGAALALARTVPARIGAGSCDGNGGGGDAAPASGSPGPLPEGESSLLTRAVLEELTSGFEYWDLERRICGALGRESGAGDAGFTLADVHAASERKSFDYRVLHHVLLALMGEDADPTLLAFLRVDEMLVDLGDDLVDYEDDVERNSFNVLRCYVRLFREDAAGRIVDRISKLEAEHARLLAALRPEWRDAHVARRDAAAEDPSALRWHIPRLVMDEGAFLASLGEVPE